MNIRKYMEDHYSPPGGARDLGKHVVFLCPYPDCPDKSGHFFAKFDKKGAVGHCRRCWRPEKDAGIDLFAILGQVLGMPRKDVFRMLGEEYFDGEASMAELEDFLSVINGDAEPAVLFDSKSALPPRPGPPRARVLPKSVPKIPPSPKAKATVDYSEFDARFEDILDPPTMMGMKAQKYLFGRGITPALIQKYHLRYAEKNEGLGSKDKVVEKDGRQIWPLQTRMNGRVMIPVVMDGKVVFYQGRAFLGKIKHWECKGQGCGKCDKGKADQAPKYKNPIQGHDLPIGAGQCLFGLDAARGKDTVVVVEGPPDVMSVGSFRKHPRWGRIGTVGLMGHGVTWERVQLILGTGCKQVILWYDQGLGVREKLKMYEALSDHIDTLWTISRIQGKKDPGEMAAQEVDSTLDAAQEMGFEDRAGLTDLA